MAWLPPLIWTYYNFGPESTIHAWIVPAICLYSNCSTEHNFQVLLGMGHRGKPTPLSLFPTASLRFRCGCSNTPMPAPALLPLVVFSVYA